MHKDLERGGRDLFQGRQHSLE